MLKNCDRNFVNSYVADNINMFAGDELHDNACYIEIQETNKNAG